MHPASKIAVPIALLLMAFLPNIWLVSDPPLVILFWLLGLPTLAGIPMHYCGRCRHFDCPLNTASGSGDPLEPVQ